jgi:hypothetical protein
MKEREREERRGKGGKEEEKGRKKREEERKKGRGERDVGEKGKDGGETGPNIGRTRHPNPTAKQNPISHGHPRFKIFRLRRSRF